MLRIRPTLLSALLLLLPVAGNAQIQFSPRSVGMGGALLGAARGQEAIFLNPAHLGLADSPHWSVSLLGVTAGGFTRGVTGGEFVDLVRLQDLEEAERRQVFERVPATGVGVGFDVRAPLVGIQVGPVGVGLAYTAVGGHNASRDLVELFMFGYEQGRTDYSVQGTEGTRVSVWDLAVAYGASTGPVSWGVTAHGLRGGSLVRSWLSDPRYDLISRDIDVAYTGVILRGGTGVALDFGAAFQPGAAVTLSGSVTNAFSRINWSDDLRVRQLRLDGEGIGTDPLDIITLYEQSERAVQAGDERLLMGIDARALQRDAHLPTTLNLGVGWNPRRGTHLAASIAENLIDGALGGEWSRTVAAGIEQKIPLTHVRAGVASNLDGGTILSGGLTLGPIDLGLARIQDRSDTFGSRSGLVAVFGLSTRTASVRGRR